MDSFSAEKNWARVAAGYKGGPMFNNPITPPKMTFVKGWPEEVTRKLGAAAIPQSTPTDPWGSRRK